ELQESISGAIALLLGQLHPPHHIKHLPRRVRAPECDRNNGCRQQFRWGHERWGLTGWERSRSLCEAPIALYLVSANFSELITNGWDN
ncbi:hypothetical protein, partial [Lyngbya sp. CCY1209]|uniref:hypothetical protein n=1 Tax=Lyngbya sp. CCY1209 TaxID=2886103 RepID=UPI002D207E36